jgi:hypothetical protein
VGEPNVSLMPLTVSTPDGGDRLLTLQRCRSSVPKWMAAISRSIKSLAQLE